MRDRDTLIALAEWAEKESESELSLLSIAFGEIHGWLPTTMQAKDMPAGALERQARFKSLLRARAFLDAAMTLVPERDGEARWRVGNQINGYPRWTAVAYGHRAHAATAALALTAAALRAHAAIAEKGGGR